MDTWVRLASLLVTHITGGSLHPFFPFCFFLLLYCVQVLSVHKKGLLVMVSERHAQYV